jgi:hypothetical protein
MFGDARQKVPQIAFRVDAIQLRCSDQAVYRRSAFAAAVRPSEQVVLPAESDRAQRSLRGIMPRTGLCRVEVGSGPVRGDL